MNAHHTTPQRVRYNCTHKAALTFTHSRTLFVKKCVIPSEVKLQTVPQTVKPVLSGNSKIDKTNGSLMMVECIKRQLVLKTIFGLLLSGRLRHVLLYKSKNGCKDQEWIQSSTTPDRGYNGKVTHSYKPLTDQCTFSLKQHTIKLGWSIVKIKESHVIISKTELYILQPL